jgi:hypothetical protein
MNLKKILADVPHQTSVAVAHYWKARALQRDRQLKSGKADQGLRSAVTAARKWTGL